MQTINRIGVVGLLGLVASASIADSPSKPAMTSLHPTDAKGLICFWDFQEDAGQVRHAKGAHDYPLVERNGPIRRVEGGVWGRYCAKLDQGQWLCVRRQDCLALDLHGRGAQYTILAWVQCQADLPWQYIAGVWNETDAKRQYALFVNGLKKTDSRTFTRTPARMQAHAYTSAEGGATSGRPVRPPRSRPVGPARGFPECKSRPSAGFRAARRRAG